MENPSIPSLWLSGSALWLEDPLGKLRRQCDRQPCPVGRSPLGLEDADALYTLPRFLREVARLEPSPSSWAKSL